MENLPADVIIPGAVEQESRKGESLPSTTNIAAIGSPSTYPPSEGAQDSYPLPPGTQTQLVVYDTMLAPPRIEALQWSSVEELMTSLPVKVSSLAKELGGKVPFSIIKELCDNFIHADFVETVVSISKGGNSISFSDLGPGIADKRNALLPGFTSANKKMKPFIRGVGFGLCMVNEYMLSQGGHLSIQDNMGRGTVVSISLEEKVEEDIPQNSLNLEAPPSLRLKDDAPRHRPSVSATQSHISSREEQVLMLFCDHDELGPSMIHDELGLSLGTAHRTLDALECAGLVYSTTSRKRILTDEGMARLYHRKS